MNRDPLKLLAWKRRSKPIERGKALRKVSAKQRAKDRELAKSRRLVMERANGKCEVIGCGLPGVHVHHRRFRSQGGNHDLSNLALLCEEHHERSHNDRDWGIAQGLVVPRSAEVQEPERYDGLS